MRKVVAVPLAWDKPRVRAALARCLAAALVLAPPLSVAAGASVAAAASAPRLLLIVEPHQPVAGTRAEFVAEVTPARLGVAGATVKVVMRGPSRPPATAVLSRVTGGGQALWEGLLDLPTTGSYTAVATFTGKGGSPTLTATRSFKTVTGSPLQRSTSFIVVILVLGVAWYLMRRQRR